MTDNTVAYMMFVAAAFVLAVGYMSYRLAKRHSRHDAKYIMGMVLVMAGCQVFAGARIMWWS